MSLQIFLATVVTSKINTDKIPSVAQAIIQLVHPLHFLAPLQVREIIITKQITIILKKLILDRTSCSITSLVFLKSAD